MDPLPQKELIIAVIEKGDTILMRKKPDGSLPYRETWYLFGCEPVEGQSNEDSLKDYLKNELGIEATISQQLIPEDLETKTDHDGIVKEFIYRNLICHYINGNPKVPAGAERVEWVLKNELNGFDLVPPSRKLLKKIGYLN